MKLLRLSLYVHLIQIVAISYTCGQSTNDEPNSKGEQELFTNVYSVPPDLFTFFRQGDDGSVQDPFAPKGEQSGKRPRIKTAKQIFEESGIEFGPGATVIYGPATSSVIVKNTPEELEKVEILIDSIRQNQEVGIRIRTDVFEAPRDAILNLVLQHDGDAEQSKALRSVLEWVSQGKAHHKAGLLTSSRSGQTTHTGSGSEVSWISDYVFEEGAWLPNIERRNVGAYLEVAPALGRNGRLIDITLNLEYHFKPPDFRKTTVERGDGKEMSLDIPSFHCGQIDTQIVIPSGHTRILGSFGIGEADDRGYLVFISAKLWRLEDYRKVFDEAKSGLPN